MLLIGQVLLSLLLLAAAVRVRWSMLVNKKRRRLTFEEVASDELEKLVDDDDGEGQVQHHLPLCNVSECARGLNRRRRRRKWSHYGML